MNFLANLFGYLLNFLYNIIGNYGWAIIVFCIVIKLLMLPLAIKQQKTLKKNQKLQTKMKEIQFKYKNDPERLNQATMQLYQEEKINPFSGCLSGILQIVLLISVFYLVRSPLTFMKKIDTATIEKYSTVMKEEELTKKNQYPEIEIIKKVPELRKLQNEKVKEEELTKIETNMQFLGLDLSQIPSENKSDWKVFIIPVLYVVVSFISMKTSLGAAGTSKKENQNLLNEDNSKVAEENTGDLQDVMGQTSKNMSLVFPIMYLSIAIIAPLGLALYWLVNSVLMMGERLILNKLIKDDE